MYLIVAVLAGSVAHVARARVVEAVESRQESDLFAELSRLMLAEGRLRPALPEASRRLARALELPSASIEHGRFPGDEIPHGERRVAFPLRYGAQTGVLIVPAGLHESIVRRLRERVVPQLETLMGAAYELEATSSSVSELATEQATLRRLAALVARGAPPGEVVAAVAAETAMLLEADATSLVRYEASDAVSVIAEHGKPGTKPPAGRRLAVDRGITDTVLRTSRPARADHYADRDGAPADRAHRDGVGSAVGAPIVVEGRVWGALLVRWSQHTPPPGTEDRLALFTELVATAVANSENRSELSASRARIAFAADSARRHPRAGRRPPPRF
ncbi:GAF domain-containing protein [Dactylosporangium darangshiense]|uniref:GAF domain-containing protein n=1 Tax=Dactylosporangium darangshiense TaxID=579108 RepID=A0ABP8DVJ7_9ACTN